MKIFQSIIFGAFIGFCATMLHNIYNPYGFTPSNLYRADNVTMLKSIPSSSANQIAYLKGYSGAFDGNPAIYKVYAPEAQDPWDVLDSGTLEILR
jgi:hypothetical protein